MPDDDFINLTASESIAHCELAKKEHEISSGHTQLALIGDAQVAEDGCRHSTLKTMPHCLCCMPMRWAHRLASIPRRAPMAFSIAFGGAKSIAADVFVQTHLERKETLDTRRALVFLAFGLFQVGFVQYMLYSKLFPFIFPGAGTFSEQTLAQMARDTQGLKNILKQVSLDMLVYHPCCYFPVFYICQEIARGNADNPCKTVYDAIQNYVPNALEDWINLWKIFVPVSFFQNACVPVHLRVPFVATAGFFYMIILSFTRGDEVS